MDVLDIEERNLDTAHAPAPPRATAADVGI